MPEAKQVAKRLAADLAARIVDVILKAHAAGRESAFAEVRALLDGKVVAKGIETGNPGPRGLGAPSTRRRRGAKRKNPWAGLSPKARLARVNAIRRGRGLPVRRKL